VGVILAFDRRIFAVGTILAFDRRVKLSGVKGDLDSSPVRARNERKCTPNLRTASSTRVGGGDDKW
jgi:hypothetical protein